MYIVVEAPPDRERWARIVRQVRGPVQAALPVLGAVIVVVGVVLIATGHGGDNVGVIAGAMGGGVALFIPPLVQRRQLRKVDARPNGAWTYVLTDAGITAQSATTRSDLSWAALIKVRETATDFLFFLAKNQVVAVPRDRFPAHSQAELSAFLRTRGLTR